MSALSNLASLLNLAVEKGSRPMSSHDRIDDVIAKMEAQAKGRSASKVPEDLQLKAVSQFWQSQEVQRFRDAYLLSWSLCLPHRPQGLCILEDRSRLQRVLDGVNDWKSRPNAFRRCYQGLVKSYFTYDALAESSPMTGRDNWKLLRDYLKGNVSHILDNRLNPDWVETAVENQQLFGNQPCEPYVDTLLRGDSSKIDHICEHLGIDQASWFLRELILAQVNEATQRTDTEFQTLLPRLLDLLATNGVLRDRGMILVLDRYARVEGVPPLHQGLRNSAVDWWGNPWLPSSKTCWGGVRPETRAMVADWLKLEFIETFFTKLAEDGLGDPRRMNFWKRYVKAIDHIEFALGASARNSKERDFVVLRKKMRGLLCDLDTPGANNAFIMRMGPLVAVEFSGMGNAFYGYDARKSVPFDTTQMLRLNVNGRNSLKNKSSSIMQLLHKDGIHGWDGWERMFDAMLRKKFGIYPLVAGASSVRNSAPPMASSTTVTDVRKQEPYSRAALDQLSRAYGFRIEDLTERGGNLWVRVNDSKKAINDKLSRWNFRYKPGKGWWR
jgi:hypothetical protein